MMKQMFLLMLLCSMCDLVSNPRKKREAQEQKIRELENSQIAQQWQKQYMPLINPQTNCSYNFTAFALLAILCGPLMMIEPVKRNDIVYDCNNVQEPTIQDRIASESRFEHLKLQKYKQVFVKNKDTSCRHR